MACDPAVPTRVKSDLCAKVYTSTLAARNSSIGSSKHCLRSLTWSSNVALPQERVVAAGRRLGCGSPDRQGPKGVAGGRDGKTNLGFNWTNAVDRYRHARVQSWALDRRVH